MILDAALTGLVVKMGGRQEAKDVCLTYNPPDGMPLDDLLTFFKEALADLHLTNRFDVTRTNSAVDIGPKSGA